MALRRRNKIVIWEWFPSGKHRESNKESPLIRGLTLLAAAAGLLYVGWLSAATASSRCDGGR